LDQPFVKVEILHNVGKILTFLKSPLKRGPTHVEANFPFFFQDFFGESKNGHLFCPFFKKAESPGRISLPPLHKNFLACQTEKIIYNLLR